MPRFTIDTNILVYSFDTSAGARHTLAHDVIAAARQADCWLTLQVVSETYAALTRKRKVPAAAAGAIAEGLLDLFPTVGHTPAAVRHALRDAVAGRLAFYDALIVATAAGAGCGVILSEDMSDGARFGGVEIVNPFAGDALSARAATLLGSGEAAL
jgi:predicted nucleic acid-binding protein